MPKVCLDDYPELPRWVPSRTAGHSSRSGSEVLISVGVCHFTLQGAHSSTIAEATGRATMFLGAVSGGLVALGLIATAAGVSTAFYAFALILLPALALLELVTFNWALQSGIEDFGYASRIAQFRGFTSTTHPNWSTTCAVSRPPSDCACKGSAVAAGRSSSQPPRWSGSSPPYWPARRSGSSPPY
jgi:hypothetical protein